MNQQNYHSEEAFQRWRRSGLRTHLETMRKTYGANRFRIKAARDNHPSHDTGARMANWLTVKFGRVTWGVFARAFWAIYRQGSYPLFFGSVVCSFDREDEDAPNLFEIAEDIRTVRDQDVPVDGMEDFARLIRDDYAMTDRMEVPELLAGKRGVYLQSIGIERAKLPAGYLHHRLVPIITHRRLPYATVLDSRHWGPEFAAIWQSGSPVMSPRVLEEYQEMFPEVEP